MDELTVTQINPGVRVGPAKLPKHKVTWQRGSNPISSLINRLGIHLFIAVVVPKLRIDARVSGSEQPAGLIDSAQEVNAVHPRTFDPSMVVVGRAQP
jgi:hypothetical protein